MSVFRRIALSILISAAMLAAYPQVVINEGTNRNYLSIADEDGDYPDWIELFNAGPDTVHLLDYTLTDKVDNPVKWSFPNVTIAPGGFLTVFCSGKDRKPVTGFVHVVNSGPFVASVGWNSHTLSTPFYWDGQSNLLVNTCSYSSAGYTTNSVFDQTLTGYPSTVFSFQDGSPAACSSAFGTQADRRPDIRLNGIEVGQGNFQNSPYDYPAPYGNWYWGARNQMLYPASDLVAAGMTAGPIDSIAFEVVSTDPNTSYDYIEVHMKLVTYEQVSSAFDPVDTSRFLHTNFRIAGDGESVYLYSPQQELLSELFVHCSDLDNSTGLFPDATPPAFLFQEATPSATNNNSAVFTGYLSAPAFSVPSGFYSNTVNVAISDPNPASVIHYTLDGSDPTPASPAYAGVPLGIGSSGVLRARAFNTGWLPSRITVATYFFDVEHTTPVLSVVTDESNLYGPAGIFDNWWFDWERTAYVEYFDSLQQLVFSQRAGIQVDGGAGGSRSQPQHSFRVELDDGVLGDGPVSYPLIPNRSNRFLYGKFYLRNGSNQYLVLPYKDACQVELMTARTHGYYSAWRPVSVYINGSYFGLYELREKFDTEYFETLEGADPETMDILSLSYWYGGALRALAGNVDSFHDSYEAFDLLDPADTSYWAQADQHFDLTWYTDYIIGESWIANNDWPWNNIKIYRSDMTDYRWRFCTIDLELSLQPNGWTDCYFDHIGYMLSQSPSIPYINIWLKSIENERYRNYFINRFADVMNTAYREDRLQNVENNFYFQTLAEMDDEYGRWGDPWNIPQQVEAFSENHFLFQEQLFQRTQQVRNHIQDHFQLTNQVDVTLNVQPPGAGHILISTVTPDEYPWQGVYFNDVPIRVRAISGDGFQFDHWEDNGLIADTLDPLFEDLLNDEATQFTAWFSPITTGTDGALPPEHPAVIVPNPVQGMLTVLLPGERGALASYDILDLQSRLVMTGVATINGGTVRIDAQPVRPGCYYLRLRLPAGKQETIRFIKIE